MNYTDLPVRGVHDDVVYQLPGVEFRNQTGGEPDLNTALRVTYHANQSFASPNYLHL